MSSLGTLALAAPSLAETVDDLTPSVEHGVEEAEAVPVLAEEPSLAASEPLVLTADAAAEVTLPTVDIPVELPVLTADAPAEFTAVPSAVLAQLSPEQIQEIAAIIARTESTSQTSGAILPAEVLAQVDALSTIQEQVGQRRRLPFRFIRNLRLPQVITNLIRQPKNAGLVMLGNRILVVNPITGAILGSILSSL
ncbi:hypothetical protein C7293_24045 [filamentous cyanobacterium CCT1]|nr:hypothetical protein C7293_24045 [filamentous cyanobacterium CCT1]PSN81480.1 hypothetical protein C8B47_00895 [filamentous cyanobacterium CCP4]